MSKVILVIDMPKSCNNCPCFDCGDDRCCCNALNKDFTNEDTRIIYNDCPLKPLPQKMKADYDTISSCEVTEKVVAMGWNACISAILGE